MQNNIIGMDPDPPLKTGFQAKFLNPLYKRLTIDRRSQDEIAVKNNDPSKDNKIDENKLDDLLNNSHKPLFKAKTAIPFDLFPNEIIIDINKINIIFRYFFFSRHIHSVFIKDISDVIVETSIIYSTLKIVDVGFTENSIDLKYLTTGKAIKARRIIQGLIVAHKNGVDLSKCEFDALDSKLDELGKANKGS